MPSKQVEDAYEAMQAGAPKGVRIIKRGSLPEKQLHRGTCHRCRTEVEFERGVAKFTDDQRDGAFLSIPCPVCGAWISTAA